MILMKAADENSILMVEQPQLGFSLLVNQSANDTHQ